MNNKIANIIVDYIKDLDWIDKLAGLTQVAKINQNGVEKRYPISCSMAFDDVCVEGCYDELAPNSAYQSVVYFEDGGVSFSSQRGNKLYYESNLRLIAWLNYKKLGGGCGSTVNYIIDLIRSLPSFPVSIDDLLGVNIQVSSQAIRGTDIFGKYTFNEKQTQYFMLPYDAFALDIKTTFFLIPECVKDTGGCLEC